MPWIITTTRPSGRFYAVDDNDEEDLLNGFACEGEIRSFSIACPACGSEYQITALDRHPRVFDRRKQRFRCSACRFAGRLRVTVDCGFAPEQPTPGAVQS